MPAGRLLEVAGCFRSALDGNGDALNSLQHSSTPIRCAAFDAVGTLIYPEPSVSRVYWDAGREHGSQQSLDQVRAGFNKVFQDLATGARQDYSTSELDEKERWRQIVRQVLFDVRDPDACFEILHAHFARPTAWRVFPDVAATLQRLVEQGIEVLVASNFDERLHPICDELPELRHLRRRVISASIGWHKPSPNFYAQLVEIAGYPAAQIMMVGDDYDNDVAAAKACGLQSVWINRQSGGPTDSIRDLRQLVNGLI